MTFRGAIPCGAGPLRFVSCTMLCPALGCLWREGWPTLRGLELWKVKATIASRLAIVEACQTCTGSGIFGHRQTCLERGSGWMLESGSWLENIMICRLQTVVGGADRTGCLIYVSMVGWSVFFTQMCNQDARKINLVRKGTGDNCWELLSLCSTNTVVAI